MSANLGTARGNITFSYDSRGILRARDDMGRFVSMSDLMNDGLDDTSRRGNAATRSLAGLGSALATAAKYLAIAGAASNVLVSGLAAVVAVTQSFIPIITASLATLPGLILAAAVTLGVLKAALSGVADAMKAAFEQDLDKFNESIKKLAPNAQAAAKSFYNMISALKPLQQAIQNTTFANLAAEIDKIPGALLPIKEGATDVASGFNHILLEVAKLASSPVVIQAIAQAFQGVSEFLKNISTGIAPLLTGFSKLAGQAGTFFSSFGEKAAGAMEQFGNFLASIDLKQMWAVAEPLLAAFGNMLKDLGSIAAGIGSGISSVIAPVEDLGTAGANASNGLGAVVSKLAEFINSAAGQSIIQSLTKIVLSLSDAFADVLGATLTALAPILASLAPLIESLSNALGAVLTTALAALAPALAVVADALNGELGAILPSLVESFTALAPPIAQIASVLASVLAGALKIIAPLLSKVASIASGVLAAALTALVPHIEKWGQTWLELSEDLLPTLLPMLEELGPALIEMAPVVAELASLFLQLLIPAMKAFVPIVATIIAAGLPLITLFANIITWLAQIMTKFSGLSVLVTIVTAVCNAIAFVFRWLFNLLIGNSIIPDLVNGITRWFTQGAAMWTAIWNALKGALAAIWNTIKSVAESVWNAITSAIRSAINGVKAAFTALAGLPAQVGGYFRSMLSAVQSTASSMVSFLRGIPGQIISAFSSLGGALVGIGRDLIQGLVNGIRGMAGAAIGAAQSIANSVKNTISSALKIGSPSKIMIQYGQWTTEGLAIGIEDKKKLVQDAIVEVGNVAVRAAGVDVVGHVSGTSAGTSQPASAAPSSGVTVNQTVNALPGMDAKQVGDYALRKIAFGVTTGTLSFVGADA